jgi:hypothetical protein
MWRSIDIVWTDVSEERIASIFRVANSASEELALAGGVIVAVAYILERERKTALNMKKVDMLNRGLFDNAI